MGLYIKLLGILPATFLLSAEKVVGIYFVINILPSGIMYQTGRSYHCQPQRLVG